ncbi:transmembrane protein 44 isoform X4 [Hylobates moloch]|uniref:transmembrane protein 44 isoform X4 n=1 Tax=Hylobates moloch TaxID=81572 RepID=UPI0026758750|nr:transmembrane protein 44 isoform X4 [Hylobates moloch]
MGEAPSPAPALWDWDYLDRCFARHRVCISFGLWICASSCWIAAHALDPAAPLPSDWNTNKKTPRTFTMDPVLHSLTHSMPATHNISTRRLLYLRCAQKSRQDQSALCAACCLLTSLCDTVGAVLARQLTIQVFTGAYLAAIDLVNFMFILFPVCGSKFKSNSGREARERKRRRHLRASVFALALPLILGPCWALWVAVPKASATIRGPQRRLLASLLQGNTEIFGYLLGSIAAFGSWASRIPPLSRINSDWVPLTTLSHCKSLRTMTAISRYMELTIEPVQQAGCSATRLPGDGQTSAGDMSLQEPPSYPPVQVIRARVSSGSSSEVSSVNSDLEQKYWEALNSEQWDPEDVNLEGSKENVELLGSQVHRDPVRTAHLSDDD